MVEVERRERPKPAMILELDGTRIGFCVDGGDASQEGAAIRVSNIDRIRREIESRGVDIGNWRIDGLCYYFHEPFCKVARWEGLLPDRSARILAARGPHVHRSDELIKHFRALCLEFPETSEASSWGHPNFRAGRKTFATVEWFKGRPSFAYRLGPETTDELRQRGSRFFLTPYGRGQWLSMWIDRKVDWRVVRALLDRSYRSVALKRMIIALDGTTENADAPR